MDALVWQVNWLLEVLIKCCALAPAVLLGLEPAPDGARWLEMVKHVRAAGGSLGVRIDKSLNVDRLLDDVAVICWCEGVIKGAGGWGNIVESARAIKAFYASDWKIFCLHLRYVRGESRTDDASDLAKVAALAGVAPRTVIRKRYLVPRRIAEDACGGFQRCLGF